MNNSVVDMAPSSSWDASHNHAARAHNYQVAVVDALPCSLLVAVEKYDNAVDNMSVLCSPPLHSHPRNHHRHHLTHQR